MMPVLKTALYVLAGLMLGVVVHILSVFALPRLAPDDARARLAGVAPVNRITTLSGSSEAALPLADPAFETAVCRYDLAGGVLHVRAPVTSHYTAVSLYTATGVAFGAINDKAATRRTMDLFVVTAAQRREFTIGEDDTANDNLVMVSPTREGFVLIRALAVQPSFAPIVRDQLAAQALCEVLTPEQAPTTD
ncbi:DUF1254 domain-containing protein [Phreatobacter aquaticus]|uniref:DUF1254 domain-containing protein n=1 Tax=Phreatobacter aquaticus TaxID=2570229 RepID=A0A4D7QH36_9HYPH|nr:DUF1254 domain-containing protein [Phreatobacter aquaticus]QCK86598.1 DUF1254 domain-containing protein [Phreatobacter aquaticus]